MCRTYVLEVDVSEVDISEVDVLEDVNRYIKSCDYRTI